MRNMLLRYDYTLVALWLALICIGFVMVASASIAVQLDSSESFRYVFRHGIYILLGFLLVAVVVVTPLHIVEKFHKPALVVALLLCLLVLIPGIGIAANGSRRWINFRFGSVQASEISKLLFVLYLAGYFARTHGKIRSDIYITLRPVLITALLCFLILLEPDFGSVVVLACATTGLLFVSGAKLRHFLTVLLIVILCLLFLSVLQPYRVERMITFLDPWSYALSSGYQLTQALIAFGRGELVGLGLGEGVQKLFYLPEAHNDFIFAVVAEELGLIGSLAVIALLMLLTLRIFKTARVAMKQERYFAAYLNYGAGIIIGAQSFINVGVNTGMLPTKGLTLPFISYGGNSLLVCCVLLGFALRSGLEQDRS